MSAFDDDSTAGCLTAIAAVVLIGMASWGIRACYIAQEASLGRAEEKVKTDNFEQSQAYREGLRRNFDELVLAYKRARSDEERSTIIEVLRHRVQGAPPEAVPQDIKDFLRQHSND